MTGEVGPEGGAAADDEVTDAMIATALRDLESPREVPEQARARILNRAFAESPPQRDSAGDHRPVTEIGRPTTSPVDPDSPEGSPRRRWSWVVSAAAAGVILVLGAVLVVWDGSEQLVTEPATTVPSSVPDTTAVTEFDSAAVREACAGFDTSAFAPRTRAEVTGPAQMEVLATYDEAAAAAEQVEEALVALRQNLREAGIDDDGVERELSNAIVAIERLADPTQNSGVRVDRVWSALTEVELALVDLERRMIELGQTSCP